jgi:hypothetical protein
MLFERFRDFERTTSRLLHTVAENEPHSVASRQSHQLLVRRFAYLSGLQDDLGQLTQTL